MVTLQRLLTSFRPNTIVAAYVAVSIAIVVVVFFYYSEGCRIEQLYSGSSSDHYCIVGGGWTFFSSWTLFLFIPVTVSMTLLVLRVIRWQSSAPLQRSVIFALTTASEVSLFLIILGSLFGVALVHEHAGNQCGGWANGISLEYQQSCNKARAVANFSSSLLQLQVALCIAGVVLTYLYWRYYGRAAPNI